MTQPRLIDISHKGVSHRRARACAYVRLPPEVMQHVQDGEIQTAKGTVFPAAIMAGVIATKKTSDWIPFCHPVSLEDCDIRVTWEEDNLVKITCRVVANAKTGVEMEALVGASAAALTLYDMCKGLSHDIVIERVQLLEKTGGKSDFHRE